MSNEIGELLEDAGQVSGQWRIPNFLALTEEASKVYYSPEILFLGFWWRIRIYPNGGTDHNSKLGIGFDLLAQNIDLPKRVKYSIGFINADGQKLYIENSEQVTFSANNKAYGLNTFISISTLQNRKREWVPGNTFSVCYILKSGDLYPMEGSLSKRLWNVSQKWNDILSQSKRTDVVLQLKDGEIPAHKMVLESSSAVFRRMFDVDMKENRTGEVKIEDATASAFRVALSFAYSGVPTGLSDENVFDVYRVAHKYQFEELRKFTVTSMQKALCLNTVCRVTALADLYGDTALKESAVDYFAKNKAEIFKTEEWKTFRKDNAEISCEILECVLARDV